jgi:small subunit ribosomal protein S1
MPDNDKDFNPAAAENFEKMFEGSVRSIKEGEIVKGTIVHITKDAVVVDIGYKTEGQIPASEFTDPAGVLTVNVGDAISVFFERGEDDNGYLRLSKTKADQLKIWDDIIEASEKDKPIKGTITQRVKGGFYADINGVTAFLPSSQVDLKPVRNPDKLIGMTFDFKVLKYNRRKNNVIVSRRVILEAEREVMRGATLAKLEEGAVVDGTVKNITDYGAFIDLGGIDGLVHLTDLSWGKVNHPSQVLGVGDVVKVKILKFNKEDGKISLGLKQSMPDPWLTASERYQKGKRLTGKVVNVTDYGAFVELETGLEGLVHISEMSWAKLKHPSQKVKAGDEVEVMVLDVDPAQRRISLGMRQVEPNPWDTIDERYPVGTRIKGPIKNITTFGMFVGLEDGIDGLVHVSDLSWKKVKHPSELYKKGDVVEAVVVNVDKDGRRLSLSTKGLEPNPWEGVEVRYSPGMIVDGTVTSIADFGAFVEMEPGIEGLVHVSELKRGKKGSGELRAGDTVEVEVLNIDPDENKIGLSIRAIKERAAKPQAEPCNDACVDAARAESELAEAESKKD